MRSVYETFAMPWAVLACTASIMACSSSHPESNRSGPADAGGDQQSVLDRVSTDGSSSIDVPPADIQVAPDRFDDGADDGPNQPDNALGTLPDASSGDGDLSSTDPNDCATGGGPSSTPILMAACATEGAFGYVRDGGMPFVCARGPANAQKPACLLWRRGTWYVQTSGKVWNSDQVDLGRPCSLQGARAGFPSGTFICSVEPKSGALQWALSAGDDLLPYVRWDATETFLPLACKPPMDTSNGSQFYRATLDVDPKDSNTLYLNIEWIGPFRSRDGGLAWSPFNIAGRSLPARTTTGAPCHGEYPGFAFDKNDASRLYFIAGGAPGSEITTPFLQGGGLWKSGDSGGHFGWLGAPELNQYVSSFVSVGDGKTLLWGTTSSLGTATGTKPPTPQTKGLVYRSDDSGGTWNELPTGLWPESTASFLWVDPQRPQHYLLGVFQYLQRLSSGDPRAPGLLETSDGGATWAVLPGVHTAENAVTSENTVVAPDGKVIISCGFGSVRGAACSRSEDAGATFAPVEALSAVTLDPLDLTNQRVVGYRVAGGTPTIPIPASVMLSMDGGRTWSPTSALPADRPGQIKWDPSVKDRLYLSGDAGAIYRSNDSGTHWTKLTTYTDFINVPRTD